MRRRIAAAPAPADGPLETSCTARTVYARTTDSEAIFPGTALARDIRAELEGRAAREPAPAALDDLLAEAGAWASAERQRYSALLDRTPDEGARGGMARHALFGCAPLALASGAWLQWLSDPGRADRVETLLGLALYASDLGVGNPGASRGNAYLDLMRHAAVAQHAKPLARLATDLRIPDDAFSLPGLLLVMSRRPDDFRLEILGCDLLLRAVGLLPPLALVRELVRTADWTAIDPSGSRQVGTPTGLELSRRAVDAALAATTDDAHERLALGCRWALAALRAWNDALYAEIDASRDPAHDMAQLLRTRAREGAVYHQTVDLAGRPLSDWLLECRTDPRGLLDALASSRLVRPGRSLTSPLVTGLVSEHGRMFRVFAPEDLAVIRRWIDALPARPAVAQTPDGTPRDGAVVAARRGASPGALAGSLPTPLHDTDPPDHPPASLREAYHLLLRRANSPALRRFALAYVRGWTARSRHRIGQAEDMLPRQETPEGLRPWLLKQHERHAAGFDPGSTVPSREALIDSTVQLAPLTLIDGSWLQGFTDYEHATSEFGHFLFETYWDELGNGDPDLNHPLIYREVLAEMGVTLPPTDSREFAHAPILRDRSFELPVYWLCIGRLPRTFMPEVLGLNLAMELSGVGGSYRQARIALEAHGFSTRFVDIHNTIDNVATGHSAWAADAVDTYLTELGSLHGARARAVAWERVRIGYRSLDPPSTFLARRAERQARRAEKTARGRSCV